LTLPTQKPDNWKKLKQAIVLLALGAIAITFISGTAIFVYQMLSTA
jgi:hypothetical protein